MDEEQKKNTGQAEEKLHGSYCWSFTDLEVLSNKAHESNCPSIHSNPCLYAESSR